MAATSELLKSVSFGGPIVSGSMFILPLYRTDSPDFDLLTLDEALAEANVVVAETSEHGSVPELAFDNMGTQPLFLLDGEQVIGLKQNRTFNLSMLLPPNQRTVVPVSCLERGRWSMKRAALLRDNQDEDAATIRMRELCRA